MAPGYAAEPLMTLRFQDGIGFAKPRDHSVGVIMLRHTPTVDLRAHLNAFVPSPALGLESAFWIRCLLGCAMGLLLNLAMGCSGGSGAAPAPPPEPPPQPLIQSFTLTPNPVVAGEPAVMIPSFLFGTGRIDPSPGPCTSGVKLTVAVEVDTVFTLTVTNSQGQKCTSSLTLRATPRPPVGFRPTGTPAYYRRNPSATLLSDGRVLLMGGDAAQSECYDPDTGLFKKVGPELPNRLGHASVLLRDGSVMVSGGGNGFSLALDSTLRFDPAMGTFSGGARMANARVYHTATLLLDGRVLLTGGNGQIDAQPVPLATAELYDPVSRSFRPTGSMVSPRTGHSATLLSDGKVLILGGQGTIAELYDPATETFTSTGSLATQRWGPRATLLASGKVLVTGGFEGHAEIFDPATGLFSSGGTFRHVGSNPSAALLKDGTVLLVGGEASVKAWLYDPKDFSLTPTGSMSRARTAPVVLRLLNDRVLVCGGDTWPGGSAELYGFPNP